MKYTIRRASFALAGLFMACLMLGACDNSPSTQTTAEASSDQAPDDYAGATIITSDFDGVTIHSFTAPYEAFGMSTYIVESDAKLVLFDAQMFTPFAAAYRRYADSLGKPIDRIIVTHGHPDHYLGLVAFEDVGRFASAETMLEVNETGEATRAARREMIGEIVPGRFVGISDELAVKTTVIDGVTYEFAQIYGGEHDPMLITRLPKLGAIFVGDTAMNGVHLFLAGDPKTWIQQIELLKADESYESIYPGHGLPADRSVYHQNIAYLTKASEYLEIADTGAEFKNLMVRDFPNLDMVAALDFFLPYLFPAGQKGDSGNE